MSLPKKIFLISSSLLAIVLIFWGVYSLSFKKTEAPKTSPPQIESSIKSPEIKKASSTISLISEDAVLSPAISQDGSLIRYYSKTDRKIYQMRLDGSGKQALVSKELPGVSSILWSPDDSLAILKTTLEGKIRFRLYNFIEGKETLLDENLDTAAWIGTNKISYKYYDPSTRKKTIGVSDPDGKNWATIADASYWHMAVAPIPKTSLVSFWNEPDGFSETDLQEASVLGTSSSSLLKGLFGGGYLWSPDGDKLLISHSSERAGKKMQLAIANNKGGEYKNLDAPTFISKCVWSKDNLTVYCALPGSIPAGATLPNDYLEGKFKTADTFWKIDTSTGKKERLVDLDKISGAFDAAGLFLNQDESLLFFVNKQDEKIYELAL